MSWASAAPTPGRRFTDEFDSVRVSCFRAMGIIDPSRRTAVIPFPNGKKKLLAVAHTRLKYGGGWSYFVCPECAQLAQTLYSIDDKPLCWRCCDRLNIRHRGKWGMGREERMRAADLHLDQIMTKLETNEPLRFNRRQRVGRASAKVYRSHRLTQRMRRNMIALGSIRSQASMPRTS